MMISNNLQQILNFLHVTEKLKTILRHGWLSTGRQEDVAGHSWRMALIAILLQSKLKKKVNIERVLKMIIVHDLPEIKAGDHHAWKGELPNKKQKETEALDNITQDLSSELRTEIMGLWLEFEETKTEEAKLAQAADKLEALIQHNEADIKTWNQKETEFNLVYGDEECNYDKVLKEFRNLVKKESLIKIKSLPFENK